MLKLGPESGRRWDYLTNSASWEVVVMLNVKIEQLKAHSEKKLYLCHCNWNVTNFIHLWWYMILCYVLMIVQTRIYATKNLKKKKKL